MTTLNMYCRLSSLTNDDDQNSTVVPPRTRPRRRYLEDPLPLPNSNYYAIYPLARSSLSPIPLPRRRLTKNDDEIVCDLCNLLEHRRPPAPPPIKARRVHLLAKIEADDRLTSIHHYSELKAKRKIPRWISRKGFFQRVARDYFCIPMPLIKSDYSNNWETNKEEAHP